VFAAYPSTPLSSSPSMVPKQLKRSIPTYPQIYTLHLSCHSLLSQHPHSPCFLPPLPPCSLSRCIHRRLSLQYFSLPLTPLHSVTLIPAAALNLSRRKSLLTIRPSSAPRSSSAPLRSPGLLV
jgi:hypothetical protein